MIVGWLAMLIFTIHACTHMVAAGDTWVAMACGRHFVSHGMDTVEPFSAHSHEPGPTEAEIQTWPGWARWIVDKVGIETVKRWHPTGWINQNWLTHVIFYSLVPKSSYTDGVSFSSNALVYKFCEDYYRQYAENQGDWARQDGYSLKTQMVSMACAHLKGAARGRRNTTLVSLYTSREQAYTDALTEISRNTW
jgi:hypothetical protein